MMSFFTSVDPQTINSGCNSEDAGLWTAGVWILSVAILFCLELEKTTFGRQARSFAPPDDCESTIQQLTLTIPDQLGQQVAAVIPINYDANQNANYG